jgi:hypothetical protein
LERLLSSLIDRSTPQWPEGETAQNIIQLTPNMHSKQANNHSKQSNAQNQIFGG